MSIPPATHASRPQQTAPDRAVAAWRALGGVADPEIPVISIVELGIVRDVECTAGECIVTLTPTYSGCPATRVIETDVRIAVAKVIDAPLRIVNVLAPPWTSDWIAPEARRKLAAFGIAPPGRRASTPPLPVRFQPSPIRCPNCGSVRTEEIARFGSTACKAQYRCRDCLEPFDYFKPH